MTKKEEIQLLNLFYNWLITNLWNEKRKSWGFLPAPIPEKFLNPYNKDCS